MEKNRLLVLIDTLTSMEGCDRVLIGTFDVFDFLFATVFLVPPETVISQWRIPKTELEKGGCGFVVLDSGASFKQTIRPFAGSSPGGVGKGFRAHSCQ